MMSYLILTRKKNRKKTNNSRTVLDLCLIYLLPLSLDDTILPRFMAYELDIPSYSSSSVIHINLIKKKIVALFFNLVSMTAALRYPTHDREYSLTWPSAIAPFWAPSPNYILRELLFFYSDLHPHYVKEPQALMYSELFPAPRLINKKVFSGDSPCILITHLVLPSSIRG